MPSAPLCTACHSFIWTRTALLQENCRSVDTALFGQSVSPPGRRSASHSALWHALSSGQMDEAMREMMMKPRCGWKDKHDSEGVYSRGKRFTKLGELYRIFVMRLFVPLCVFITCSHSSLIEDVFFDAVILMYICSILTLHRILQSSSSVGCL